MVLDGFWWHVLHVDIKLREGDFDMFLCKGLIDGEAQIRGRALDEGEILQPVVQGEIAHVTLDPAQLALSQRKGAGDHGQQRDDDEAEQDDETDQHHHVKGVFQHIQDQVL